METDYIIFYADDDIDDQDIFLEALELTGNPSKLFLQHDGKQLLQTLHNGEIKPDMIFLDLNMPGLNGFQTLDQIKDDETLKNIPVIIISTSNDPATIKKAQQSGASMFVSKPKDFDVFINSIKLLFAIDWRKIPPDTKTFLLNVEL